MSVIDATWLALLVCQVRSSCTPVGTKLVQLVDVGGKAVDGEHLTIGSTSVILTRPVVESKDCGHRHLWGAGNGHSGSFFDSSSF